VLGPRRTVPVTQLVAPRGVGRPRAITAARRDALIGRQLDVLVDSVGVARSQVIQGNSKNHDQDGQNVLYADGHAEFQQTSLCGANNDCIYTVGSATNTTDGKSAAQANPSGTSCDPVTATDSVLLINITN